MQLIAQFPRTHLIAAGALSLFLVGGSALLPDESDTKSTPEVVTETPLITQPLPEAIAEADKAAISQEIIATPSVEWKDIVVASGDTLSDIFSKEHLSAATVLRLANNPDYGRKLTRVYPGQTLRFGFFEDTLKHVELIETPFEKIVFTLDDKSVTASKEIRKPDVFFQYKQATIDSSLFLAGQRAGLSQNKLMDLANIFGGVIDFVLDPRSGDTFNVLYEELFLDGEKVEDGNIIAAQYINEGKEFTAFRYTDQDGSVGYYSPDGVSMRKAFLRAPLDFTRISSNFNPSRMHPVHKKIKAHRGIDYAAPRGTPVYAAGEGRVIKSGYSAPNGNYVFIQHGQKYVTKYVHLDKRKVKTGQKVSQKQIIGTVGSTGYATGPHLHYEFIVDGVHRNPRTIVDKLPKARSIPDSELAAFKASTQQAEQQLAAFRQRFASAVK